jgi:outer membrane protein assembly factor BamE (lipoprotein component of BamABCDE complex)
VTRRKTFPFSEALTAIGIGAALFVGLSALFLTGAGCTIRQEFAGSIMPEEEMPQLRIGMAKEEVLSLLGPPDTVGLRLKGTLFIYRYHNEADTGVSLSFFQASMEFESSDRRTARLLVFFDKKGRVTAFARD